MAQTKPKISDLRTALQGYVTASVATRIAALSLALQWYDTAIPYLIDKKLVDADKLKLMSKATKAREIGISSLHQHEKETAFKQSVQMLEKICDSLHPVSLQKYVDEYRLQQTKLEADEARLSSKYEMTIEFLETVFKSTGFKVTLDPTADKERSFDGTSAIVYSRAALKAVTIKLRTEGLMPTVFGEIMFFSKAKAIVPDAGTFVWKPELQVKALGKMLAEFVEYAKQDSTKWKLLRYGAPRVAAPTTQVPFVGAAPTTPATPRAPRVGLSRKQPGERYVPGTAMAVLYERLKTGQPIEKKELLKGVPSANPEGRLQWIVKHGKEKNEWSIVFSGTTVQMIIN